jgi:hypothetical protein
VGAAIEVWLNDGMLDVRVRGEPGAAVFRWEAA